MIPVSGTSTIRVGLVCPYSFARPGGVQNHVLGLAGWLRRAGHSVGILAPGRLDDEVLVAAGVRPEDFTSAGPAVPLGYNGSVARVTFGPATSRRVREWLDEGYFDLLHLHEPMTPSASLLALAQTWLPVAATFHTATPGSRSMELAYQLLPQAQQRIDAPIAVSRQAAQVVESYSSLRPRIIGNGIQVSHHAGVAPPGRWRAGERPRLTFIGRHGEPRKGFDVLVAALPRIRAVHPDLDVVVVGPGQRRAVPGVRFLGSLPDEGRNRVLERTDVYVAPQTGRESFGIVLLEALASGAPVVASDLAAFREVVSDDDGPVADLFTAGDAEALAAAVLVSLVRPRDLWLERGRRRAQQFDWAHLGPQVVAAYRDAMAGASFRGPRTPGLVTAEGLGQLPQLLAGAVSPRSLARRGRPSPTPRLGS